MESDMSVPEYRECGCRNLLADQETWEIIFEPAFCNNPGAAECLAHLLCVLKKASGDLKPWDEPRQLLEGALERFNAKRRAKSPTGTGQRPKQRKRTAAHGRS
jgi:hypothetical protein